MTSTIFRRYTIMVKVSARYNQAAISRAQNFIYNGKSRHIRHRHNIVKQLLSTEIISIDLVLLKDNLADPFKGLSEERINCATKGMSLKAYLTKST